tara:strand:- start:4 stop:351 length:348 start_codon:yes stop_codon:yes gene_type:complete
MDNLDLGIAVGAYVMQSFGEDQRDVGYCVFAERSGLRLQWDRAEEIPTEEQLEAALYRSNWDEVRKRRNSLLAETDFYALSDVVMSDAMTTYRQALRDLPESVENSEDVVWPEKP